MPLTARDTILATAPRWLRKRGGTAEALLYTIGLHVDALLDATEHGVRRRFPGGAILPDALPTIGRERRIRRGPAETDASYAARLPGWLAAHQRRGGPYALLEQVHAFYAAAPFEADLVYRNGRHFHMSAAGEISRTPEALTAGTGWNPSAWDEYGLTSQWARWWLFYRWPATVAGDGLWDDPGDYDDGGVWDSGLTAAQVAELRLIPTEWNAGHTLGTLVLTTEESASLDPTDADVQAIIGIE